MSGRKPTQDEVARILGKAIKTAESIEEVLGEMSPYQHGAVIFTLMGFWKVTDIMLHDGMSGAEFKEEFRPFIEGYLRDHFSDGEEPTW